MPINSSPLYERVAAVLSESAPLLEQRPAVILAALHDLALAGHAPALAAAYAARDGDAAAAAAIDTLARMTDEVMALATRRKVPADQTGRHTVLYPAITEAAHRAGAATIGLIDVGNPAGLNLNVNRTGITYSDGLLLGDRSSPVQVKASLVGRRPVPAQVMPEVVARIGVDRHPLDLTDEADTRWLRASLPPELAATHDAEIALAASAPPVLLRGDPVSLLPEALSRIPADVLPVVTTTWALSRLSPAKRLAFLHHLEEAVRPVAWVSAEGVGVAPSVPTYGDRPASGHSIIGVALFDGPTRQIEALGRCWSKGRLLSWLPDPPVS
ncbi:DUF2332 domain-containing protein [Actinoplanes friuliensis]|uniref:DUF2332 domain-containing protein n=1 Tax=Actinoplanes friuliensis DSM 7358 TaxID=1246995 RepID=U5VY24_9ACTN|nr:DUF2332 domain-containing protein [Actinoplanes friuliensis]AGZ41682.1 hypothetical protein AFR_17020 [Actinoplanes friuliensis DSM 7358]